ncbi:hypothetical protein V1290_000426 [Bradyrhizobium sp. AZCC 1578]
MSGAAGGSPVFAAWLAIQSRGFPALGAAFYCDIGRNRHGGTY